MRINNNFPALVALNSLKSTNRSLQKSIRTLSTGLRINSASDDAAGFAVSEKMRSQISGLDVALKNSQDGISLLQTAEGALGGINSMLQRMRELSVQASNDTLTQQDRQYIQLELDEIKQNINRVANTTQFNNKRLLDGSSGALWSCNNQNVNVKINGGLVSIDEFGQKVNAEGNYRLEVKTEAGEAQVQKSNIFNLDYAERSIFRSEMVQTGVLVVYPPEPEEDEEIIPEPVTYTEININEPGRPSQNSGWEFNNGQITITGPGENEGRFRFTGTGEVTKNYIKVNPGLTVDIYFSDVNIDASGITDYTVPSRPEAAAFRMDDAVVNLYLEGENFLTSGTHRGGLEATQGSVLTINSIDGYDSTTGELTARGGAHGAGIGGCCDAYFPVSESAGGDITIMGGTIHAYGGYLGAGIGGGAHRDAGVIKILGGDIDAHAGIDAAGIGSSRNIQDAASATIIIGGGTVFAEGQNGGAGIGGGPYSGAGTIQITQSLLDSGAVEATANDSGAQDIGAGIGYTGSYTDYENEITIPLPPIPDPEPDPYDPTPIYIPQYKRVELEDAVVKPCSIRETTRFYNSDGIFIMEQPRKLTITQGDGKTASVMLYSTDSMYDIAEKINNAISDDLGQGKYTDTINKFCTIASGPDNSSESVCAKEDVYRARYQRDESGTLILDDNGNPIKNGLEKTGEQITMSTMLVRSVIPGKTGELSFSGDEDLLNALGFNTIQSSNESIHTATVYDAHSGEVINSNVKSTGNTFQGVISANIDVEVDPMPDVSISWDENTKRYVFKDGSYTLMIHLKNNGLTFQTGANQGEDFLIQLGDNSTNALNISGVNVITRENASHSISILDRAINRISTQRAKIGAYSNALEHTINNLTTTSVNITSAESRLRDADMSKAMMEFVKLQILNQSGTSMLAQANQLPQSVINLLQ